MTATARKSFKEASVETFAPLIGDYVRGALKALNLTRREFSVALHWAREIALDGYWFLLTGEGGMKAMLAIGRLEQMGLANVAHLAGMLATLLHAGSRRDDVQGGISGKALVLAFGQRLTLKNLWRLACPRALTAKAVA